MSENKYVQEIPIKSYSELIKIIQGKTEHCEDLREKFIFRGVEDSTYEFVPSALRKGSKLDDFVDEDFKLTLQLCYEKALEYGFVNEEEKYEGIESFTINKYGKLVNERINDFVCSMGDFQIRKELNALMSFLSYADKVGLKVPVKQDIREFIERNIGYKFNHEYNWPDKDFYELISLAQHYGIPTRALDWSYDYRTALYFAVKNILTDNYLINNEKPENAILWAFNYKYFDRNYISSNKLYLTKHYRPEYNTNPNLNAQKGLFTFMIKRNWETANEPYDQYIEEFLENFNQSERMMPKKEYAFYKFIIPEDEKPNILKELYSEGYSEEYLFPGYDGVSKTIENRVKLDKLIENLPKYEKYKFINPY